MFLYTKYKVCFCHIPKTAGLSLIEYFDSVFGSKKTLQSHLSLKKGYHLIPKDYKIVFVVRNPYERIVSLKSYWSSIYSDPEHPQHSIKEAIHKFACENSFDEWVKNWLVSPNNKHPHAISSSDFIVIGNDIPRNSYILRFEDLENSLNKFMESINIKANHKLHHINKSTHKDYETYYTSELKKIIYVWDKFVFDNYYKEYIL